MVYSIKESSEDTSSYTSGQKKNLNKQNSKEENLQKSFDKIDKNWKKVTCVSHLEMVMLTEIFYTLSKALKISKNIIFGIHVILC